MSCLKIQNFKKKILPKENTQNVNLTCENLPKKLLDKIGTGNVEKIVRVLLTDKNIARYKIKYKPNGNRSERKKGDWYAVVTIILIQISKKSLPVNMEIEETTTVENNDCDFVDIGGAEQSLSHENRSWNFCNSVSLPSAEVVFFTQVCFLFILLSLSISKLSFYNLSVTRLPFGFQYYPVQLVTYYPIPSYNNE